MFGLYLLDVCVTRLTLNKEVYTDTGGEPLIVKVEFINFPATEVKERKRHQKDDDVYVFDFESGQCIQFSMICEELVKKMKRVPLSIGVFREDDSYPICYLQTYLSGCVCDLSTQYKEYPAPFRFRGPFELADTGNTFAGQLELEITVSNLGRCLFTYYALAPKCFLFKTDPAGSEYKCNFKESSKLSEGMYGSFSDNLADFGNQGMIVDTTSPGNMNKDMAGISMAANYLSEGSPPPKPPRVPLVDPSASKRKKKKKKGK